MSSPQRASLEQKTAGKALGSDPGYPGSGQTGQAAWGSNKAGNRAEGCPARGWPPYVELAMRGGYTGYTPRPIAHPKKGYQNDVGQGTPGPHRSTMEVAREVGKECQVFPKSLMFPAFPASAP